MRALTFHDGRAIRPPHVNIYEGARKFNARDKRAIALGSRAIAKLPGLAVVLVNRKGIIGRGSHPTDSIAACRQARDALAWSFARKRHPRSGVVAITRFLPNEDQLLILAGAGVVVLVPIEYHRRATNAEQNLKDRWLGLFKQKPRVLLLPA